MEQIPIGVEVEPISSASHPLRYEKDPLVHRVGQLVEHLSLIARLSKDAEVPIIYHSEIEHSRERVAVHLITWELSKLLQLRPRAWDPEFGEFQKFVKVAIKDFCEYEARVVAAAGEEKPEDLVEEWSAQFRTRVNEGEVEDIPMFISGSKDKVKTILKKMVRNIQDLLKLEEYVAVGNTEDLGGSSRKAFVKLLANEDLGQVKKLPVIVDDGDSKTHAEMRILLHIKNGERVPYIGISKLCCACCQVVVTNYGIETVFERDDEVEVLTRGWHAKLYPWPLPSALKSNSTFIKKFLGEDLYREYNNLWSKFLPGSRIKEGEMCLQLIQSLGMLCFDHGGSGNEVLSALGFNLKQFKSSVSEAPDPSIAYSRVPVLQESLKAYYISSEKRLVKEGDEGFAELNYRAEHGERVGIQVRIMKKHLQAHGIEEDTAVLEDDLFPTYKPLEIGILFNDLLTITRQKEKFTILSQTRFEDQDLIENTAIILGEVVGCRTVIVPVFCSSYWVGFTIRQNAEGNIHLIYINPLGKPIEEEPNVEKIINSLIISSPDISIVDLKYKQTTEVEEVSDWTIADLFTIAQIEDTISAVISLKFQNRLKGLSSENLKEFHVEFLSSQSMDLIAESGVNIVGTTESGADVDVLGKDSDE